MAEITFNQFDQKNLLRYDRLIRAVGIKTFSAVIMDTPVGDPDYWKRPAPPGYVGGRLRANWNCSLSMPDISTVEGTTKNFREVEAVLSEVENTCQKATRKDTLWLSNSLPYVYRIEYEGWSGQAPEGMVRRNIARIKKNISEELRKLKR